MRSRAMQVGLCIAVLIMWASAQNKISGTAKCGKPDVQQKVDIPDHPGSRHLRKPVQMHLDETHGGCGN